METTAAELLTGLLYDSSLDALLALHEECSTSSSLKSDRNVARFLNKFNSTVEQVKKNRLTIDHFEIKHIIGQGHFGEVCMVREKATSDVYAMKIMRKAHVLQQVDAAFFLEERDIMAQANSQWLASLHYAFQDKEKLYLVMEFYPGGDLLTVMQRYEGQLTEQHARFYLSEIIAGLNDLHLIGFVHRDVKPENVLITRSGHIKLIDFGSATRVNKNDGKVVESRLPVGTPEYISPEVLTSLEHGATYGVECDWWSVGIILYEMICNTTPFESDTTALTYSNIMSYKTSLHFTNDGISDDARHLICHLLVESCHRLQYSSITAHPFFNTIDWDHLISATPPFIPTIAGPEDTSNFDSFDPIEDDSFTTNKRSTGFSGRSLPFVGFTYSGTRSCDSSSRSCDSHNSKADLDVCCKECSAAQERYSSLERECVVYKSQLEDLQRKLDIERNDRRVSDSRALQLLAEIREKAQVAEDLRKTEARATHEQQVAIVVSQLEQEKADLSRRLQRLQVDMKKRKIESDNAIGKVAELRNRMSQIKETNKKDLASLQAKLTRVTESSQSRIIELQNALASNKQESDEQQLIADLTKDLMDEKLKTRDCEKLRSTIESMEEQLSDIVKDKAKLEAKIITATAELEVAHTKLSQMNEESAKMAAQHSKLLSMNANTDKQLTSAEETIHELTCALQDQSSHHDEIMKKRIASLEQDKIRLQHTTTSQSEEYEQHMITVEQQHHSQVTLLRDEISRLKRELSEVTSSALRSAEKLADLRKIKQTLEKKNHTLQETNNALQQTASSQQYTADRDCADNKRLKDELTKSKQSALDYKKQYEDQELSLVLLKRNVQSLESELADVNVVAQESSAATTALREARSVLESDLELAETKLDNALQTLSREKDQRMNAEGQVTELRNKIEQVIASSAEEEAQYKELLNQQRQTAEQCSEQLAALQKDLGLNQIKLKEAHHELSIEKSLSSKIYDDYHSLGREHGKLKAAHLKVCNQLKKQTAQLEEVSHEKEQAVRENINMAESLAVERVRLQTQTAQFTKLVDYQHTPLRSSNRKRSMRRKRDPERELAEWNKLKRMSQHSDIATPTLPSAAAGSHDDDLVPAVSTSGHVMEHNIPHRFITKSGPFHKSSSCSTCNTAIKLTQKLAKCTYCGLTCHYKCVSSVPNTCGLPSELADHLHDPPAPKRQRTDTITSKENIDQQQCDSSSLSITSSMLASDNNESDII